MPGGHAGRGGRRLLGAEPGLGEQPQLAVQPGAEGGHERGGVGPGGQRHARAAQGPQRADGMGGAAWTNAGACAGSGTKSIAVTSSPSRTVSARAAGNWVGCPPGAVASVPALRRSATSSFSAAGRRCPARICGRQNITPEGDRIAAVYSVTNPGKLAGIR
ncbi:hypothetical protein ABT158_33725 [Nonomuraea sp. NPDC001636]|uniref:hypothetical protein n=1 Tax=Nonomuraea sp. NPDC001636 TaxID=3154391 RepID=UPI00333391BB